MYDELVKDLREISENRAIPVRMAETAKEAADAIEELSAIREEQKAQIILMAAEIEELKTYAELYQSLTDKSQKTARNLLDAYQKWIPVTERLPEERTDVIAVTTEYDVYICDFIPSVKQFWTIPGDDLHIDDITHWMPLPEPPKEE